MSENKGYTPDVASVSVDVWRERCTGALDCLGELRQVHFLIDKPARMAGSQEPPWIFRLRKICLHVSAIVGWEICVDVEHVMAPELRAAYEQMDCVWRQLPDEHRYLAIDDGWWANEARNGLLATCDHPTPQSLMLSAGQGGFSDGEDRQSYGRLACWLGPLGCGYAITLGYLADVLGTKGDVNGRLTSALQRIPRNPALVLGGDHGQGEPVRVGLGAGECSGG